MKQYIPILMSFMLLFTFSSYANANVQQDVKNYLGIVYSLYEQIYERRSRSEIYLLSGNYDELEGQQMKAATEVLLLIQLGELDACCWVGDTPATFSEFASIDGAAILAGGQSTTYPKHSGGTGTFSTDAAMAEDYIAMRDLLALASELPDDTFGSGLWDFERIPWAEHHLMKRLLPLWDDLWWTFSYADDSLLPDPVLTSAFRNHYAFACVVCFGAGFYDTSRLHVKQPDGSYTATAEYDRLFYLLSPETQSWMTSQANNQYPTGINWNGKVPMQVSTGPTWQSTVAAARGTVEDNKHMYPSHCHGSTELYMEVNPYSLVTAEGTATQENQANAAISSWFTPGTTPTSSVLNRWVSVFGNANFVADMFPQVQASINDNSISFSPSPGAGFYYNGARKYHALYTGGWSQLTQWARLTSPAEGTYFPLHNTNINPSAPTGGCVGN